MFKVILADPPWRYQNWTEAKNGAAVHHYDCMSADELSALDVGQLADPSGCALLMWATFPKIEQALTVVSAWGFRYVTCAFVWNKTYRNGSPYMGLGFYTRSGSEICLLGLKGKMKPKRRDIRQVFKAPVTRHSAKPHQQYRLIEELFDGPYCELFAREERSGWTSWGNQLSSGEHSLSSLIGSPAGKKDCSPS